MIFTNPRTITKPKRIQLSNVQTVKPLPYKVEIKKVEVDEEIQSTIPKSTWGPSIWFFFHTVAHKVKELDFIKIKNDLLSHIIIICKNLPCPDCSQHASRYLEGVDMNKIQTKEDFKKMLFNFHNEVNKRLHKELFTYEKCNEKYEKGKLNMIITTFFKFFEDKHKSVRMLSNDMYTQRVSNNLRSWFTRNIHYFE